ncbi:MAG: lipopolysaccharide biosynthesis protein [Myxococcaceae bacterium]
MAPAAAAGQPAAVGGSFLGKAGPLVIARFVSALLTVSIPLVLARQLPLKDYGSYKQLFLLFQTLFMILPFGMSQSLYFFVPRSPEQGRAWFGQAMVWLFAMGLVACGAFFMFEGEVAHYFNNPELLQYKWELCVYTACLLGSHPLELWFTSRGHTKASAVSYLVSDTIRALALVIPVALGFGLKGAMVCSAGFAVIRYATCFIVLLKSPGESIFKGRLFVSQLLYAAPFGAAMLLSYPQAAAHQYAVSAVVSPELFAIYAVGVFQLPLVDLFYTPTSEVLMVRIGELEKQQRLDLALGAFKEAAAKLSLIFLPLAAFLFAAAPEFIGALFGPKFFAAVPIFRISVWGVVLASLPMDGVLRARNSTRHIFFSYLVKTIVTIPLVYFGVKRFGMLGGIESWLIAEIVGKAMLFIRMPYALSDPNGKRLSAMEIIPWPQFGKAALSACAAAVAVVAGRTIVPSGTVESLPHTLLWRMLPLSGAGLLFGAGYLTVLRLTGVRPFSVFSVLLKRRA